MDTLKGLLAWTGILILGYIALVVSLGILMLLGHLAEIWYEFLEP